MAERTCARCGASPSDVPFKKDRRAKDGLGAWCLACQRAYNAEHHAANRARRNEQTRAYYEANRPAILTQQQAYRAANVENRRRYDLARYAADPAARNAHTERWTVANRDRYLARKRRYHQTNRDRLLDQRTLRRLEAAGHGAAWEPITRREVWEAWARCCGVCGEPVTFEAMELDHIKAIANGGSHVWDNVQPAHKPCNSGKRDREE